MNNFFSVNNMTLPPEGPRVIPVNVDFAAQTEVEIDLSTLTDSNYISYVSGAWFDNSANAHDVTCVVGGSNQRILIPASVQLMLPVFAVNPPLFEFSQGANGDLLRVFFVNFPVFPYCSPVFPT